MITKKNILIVLTNPGKSKLWPLFESAAVRSQRFLEGRAGEDSESDT